ncbi:heavy-metal-associated domain-containing protein [Peribacillus sp. R9-11]|uniref:heavy-metal-associated domain-containing protein n=1 Tax=Peribacillus sp. R9-11 TaxID=3073271 RepID=UPI0028691D49|nr:heavy-metal-associated domain-containing protein [Peribacillus sp. R9-11]WMX58820.1 heavy-metal-associated domain-containing protein [Peribacillus sp. R9-11]
MLTRRRIKLEKRVVKLEGMTNEQDAVKIQSALNDVWGVRQVHVSLQKQLATLSFNEDAASYEDFLQAIKDTGFTIETSNQ